MEEIIQALFDGGVLVRNGNVKVARELSQVHLPPTVQGILAARIDRLPTPEKELLQTLAVLGREFPVGLIRSVTQIPEGELERMLRDLQLGEFIYEQPAFPDAEYSFKHALTQEVAYNSVLSERRRVLHGRIGAALEKLYGDRLEDHLAELAHHFARSTDTVKAVEYLVKAGRKAVQRSAYHEALDRLEAGLRLLESLPPGAARDEQELEIRGAMYMPLVIVRGPASRERWSNMRRARELCDQGSAPTEIVVPVLQGLWGYYYFVADMEMAHSLAGQVLALGEERGDQIITWQGQMFLGVTRAFMGEYRSAATMLERSIAICERVLPTCQEPLLRQIMVAGLISSRGHLSKTLWLLGYPGQALRQIELLHRLPRNLCGSFEIVASISFDLSTGCLVRDYKGAREKAETLRVLTKENGFSALAAGAAIAFGHIAVVQGATEEGIKALLEGSETIGASGEVMSVQLANVFLAQAFLTAGRPSEGLAAANKAITAADQLQHRLYEAELHRLKGELLLLAGAPERDAESSMRRAIAIAQRQEAKGWELRDATSLARLLRKQGRVAEARDALAPVYNWFSEGFDTADLRDAKALLDELEGRAAP
jgi:tetratricopeptide (TPR) repeat protein